MGAVVVLEGASYSQENLWALEGFGWILRVPASLKEARALLEGEFPREAWIPLLPGYRGLEVEADYGGVRQRWLLVEGEEREEEGGLRRRVARAEGEAEKALGKLLSRRFACEADARRALEEASGRLPYHRPVYLGVQEERRRGRVGRPRKGEPPLSVGHRLLARLGSWSGRGGAWGASSWPRTSWTGRPCRPGRCWGGTRTRPGRWSGASGFSKTPCSSPQAPS